MFYYSSPLELNLTGFDTSNVENMNSMFYGNKSSVLDLSSFKLKDEANKRIGYRLIVDAVVEKEKLEITDKELEDGLKESAEKYGMSVEDFEKEIGSKELFKYDLLMRKAMEIVTK